MGKWTMDNTHGENKTKRFKSNGNGKSKPNKYKSTGLAGAHSERNINNNLEDEFNNIVCEEVPFSLPVPPVPTEETVCVDQDYAIPLTKAVHQNPPKATKELELQNEDEVQIICVIPAGVLKMNGTEIKEEIEDPADASIPSVTNEELSTTKSFNNHDNVAQNTIKEESEPENNDDVQNIGGTDKSPTVQNVINTETIQEFEYPDEIIKSEGSLGEDEVINGTANTAIDHMVRGVGASEVQSSQVVEHLRQGVDELEENRRHEVNEMREHQRPGVDELEENRRQGVDEVREHQRSGLDEVAEHRRQGVGVVGDIRCCGACRSKDKIKIKMEIEMSTEQFVQVAKELPNIVTNAHVHS